MSRGTAQSYLVISTAVFGFIAIVQAVRAINGWTLVLGPVTIPISVSWLGFAIAGALCVWAIRLSRSQ